MQDRPRLLYLARDYPVPVSSTSRLRTFNWVLHLARHFEVSFVACVREPPDARHLDALNPYCSQLLIRSTPKRSITRFAERLVSELQYLRTGVPPAIHSARGQVMRGVLHELNGHSFDAVFAEEWIWGREAFRLAPLSVLDAGESQARRHAEALRRSWNPVRRILRSHLAHRFERAESSSLAEAGLVLARTPSARQALGRICGPGRTVLIPPGLDTAYFAPRRRAMDPVNIVFYASLASPAQRDALQHLQRDLMPSVRSRLPGARLTIVAPEWVPELGPLLESDPLMHFTGPLEDPRTELWKAAVAVMPLRFGSGSRNHLAQLLSLGVPVVMSPEASRGLEVLSGDGVLVAPDGSDFSEAVVQVLLDSSLREDLSRRGRSIAEQQLSMAATYERLSEILAESTTGAY